MWSVWTCRIEELRGTWCLNRGACWSLSGSCRRGCNRRLTRRRLRALAGLGGSIFQQWPGGGRPGLSAGELAARWLTAAQRESFEVHELCMRRCCRREPPRSSASGDSGTGRFPLFTAARLALCIALTWLRRKLWTSASVIAWRSAFPVSGLTGIRLHFNFLKCNNCMSQMRQITHLRLLSTHCSHCHRMLVPSQSRGRWHTSIVRSVSKLLLPEVCSGRAGGFDCTLPFAPRPTDQAFPFFLASVQPTFP